jgi:hypothetical protein
MAAIASPLQGVGSVHVNTLLSQFSIGYHPTGMIAEQVFPPVKVTKESDVYLTWDKGQALRVDRSDGYGTLRADGAESRTEDYGGTWTNYQAQEFALRTKITDRERANADAAFALEQSKVRRAQDKVLLDMELRVASICTTAANYASANKTTLSGTAQWNNASFASQSNGQHSVIMGEILAGMNAIRSSTLGGLLPNKIIIPYAVAIVMKNDVGFWDSVKYQSNSVNFDVLPPTLMGMDVLIPRVPYQTAVEGEALSTSDVWGKSVTLLYVNPSPSIDSLTFGVTLRSRDWGVKTWREEKLNTTFYEASLVQAEQLVTADCGYLIINAIA